MSEADKQELRIRRYIPWVLQLSGLFIIAAEVLGAIFWFGAAIPIVEGFIRERTDILRLVSGLLVPVPFLLGVWLIMRGRKLGRRIALNKSDQVQA